jgi:hypothetical protein
MWRIRCSLSALLVASAAPAQPVTPSPDVALDLLVWVGAANGAWSAGTLFGHRRDTLFIVTTRHTVRDSQEVRVQITRDDSSHVADVRWVDPHWDFAVLAVPLADLRGPWRVPRSVRPRRKELYWEEPLYTIGCVPYCWWPAREARHQYFVPSRSRELQPSELLFRTDFVEAGFSGGPIVDRDGAVVGLIITRTGGVTGRAIWWTDLLDRMSGLGFPVNLQPRPSLRGRSAFARISGVLAPRGGRDLDGARFRGGGRLEVGVVLAGLHEVVYAFDRVVIRGDERHAAPGRGDEPDVFILHYLVYGYRYRTRLPFIRLRQPHSVSVGFELMGPVGGWGVMAIPGDSIDVRTGEPVEVSRSVRLHRRMGMSIRSDFRAYLTERTGIIIDYALFHPSLQSLGVPDRYHRVSIGVDMRWPY